MQSLNWSQRQAAQITRPAASGVSHVLPRPPTAQDNASRHKRRAPGSDYQSAGALDALPIDLQLQVLRDMRWATRRTCAAFRTHLDAMRTELTLRQPKTTTGAVAAAQLTGLLAKHHSLLSLDVSNCSLFSCSTAFLSSATTRLTSLELTDDPGTVWHSQSDQLKRLLATHDIGGSSKLGCLGFLATFFSLDALLRTAPTDAPDLTPVGSHDELTLLETSLLKMVHGIALLKAATTPCHSSRTSSAAITSPASNPWPPCSACSPST